MNMKDTEGKVMTHEGKTMERWRENFEEIPNTGIHEGEEETCTKIEHEIRIKS